MLRSKRCQQSYELASSKILGVLRDQGVDSWSLKENPAITYGPPERTGLDYKGAHLLSLSGATRLIYVGRMARYNCTQASLNIVDLP